MELAEGAIVLCSVKKIDKTTIFLEIDGNGEGSMVLSEVAAGRIRNLREYVFPGKRIVCKVLSKEGKQVELSLRRVTAKERDEVLERNKKEKSLTSMLRTIVKNYEEVIANIKEKQELADFFEEAREEPKLLLDFFSKTEAEKIASILKEKGEKEKEVKGIFKLSSNASHGVLDIKDILSVKNGDIKYLGSSRFSISFKARDFKEANKKLLDALEEIKSRAKEKKAHFEVVVK